MKRFVIIISVNDEGVVEALKRDGLSRVQDALDREWPCAPMGTLEVVSVREAQPPSESEIIGPLG